MIMFVYLCLVVASHVQLYLFMQQIRETRQISSRSNGNEKDLMTVAGIMKDESNRDVTQAATEQIQTSTIVIKGIRQACSKD